MGGSGRDSVRVLSFSTTHSASAVRLQFKSCRRFELANDCDWSHNFWVQNQVEKSSLFRIWSQSAFENSLGRASAVNHSVVLIQRSFLHDGDSCVLI